MRWFVCMPVASLDGASMWAYLWWNQSAGVCVRGRERELVCWAACVCVCVVSPGWGVCLSDVNSVLSDRFSTLPMAVKRARSPLPPPRGLISFFILSAIQLDFLRGHRGQGPFTKRDELGVCVSVCQCVHTRAQHPDFSENHWPMRSVTRAACFQNENKMALKEPANCHLLCQRIHSVPWCQENQLGNVIIKMSLPYSFKELGRKCNSVRLG